MAVKITVHKNVRIRINGVEYDSPEQVPAELRAIYEKARQTGRSVSLDYKPKAAGALPSDVHAQPSDVLGSSTGERRVPLWVWAFAVATLAALLLYLAQHAR